MEMNPDCLVFLTHYYARKAKSLLKAGQAGSVAESEYLYRELKEGEPQVKPNTIHNEPQTLPIDPRIREYWFVNFRYFLEGRFSATLNLISEWYRANETVLNQLRKYKWASIGALYMDGGYLCIRTPDTPQNAVSKARGEIEDPVAILRGVGKIQDLTVYKVDRNVKYRQLMEAQTPKVGHYGFIVKIIHNALWNMRPKPVEDTKTLIERFVDENATKLNAIRAQFQSEPRELGGGADGIAYSIGDGMVFKIFKSEYAYRSAVDAINRLHKSPSNAGTEAMIYDAGKFQPLIIDQGNGNSFAMTFYYYIIEKMTPARSVIDRDLLSDFLSNIQNSIDAKIDTRARRWQNYKDLKMAPRISGAIKILAQKIAPGYTDDASVVEKQAKGRGIQLKSGWLPKLIEEVAWKLITDRNDLHGGNIGITQNGEFRYFDPAYDN